MQHVSVHLSVSRSQLVSPSSVTSVVQGLGDLL